MCYIELAVKPSRTAYSPINPCAHTVNRLLIWLSLIFTRTVYRIHHTDAHTRTHKPAADEEVSHQQPSRHRPHNPGGTCFCLRSISYWSAELTVKKKAIRSCQSNSALAIFAVI